MPGAMRKMGVYLGLVEDGDSYGDGYDERGYDERGYDERGYDSPRERDAYREAGRDGGRDSGRETERDTRRSDVREMPRASRPSEYRVERGPSVAPVASREWSQPEVYVDGNHTDWADDDRSAGDSQAYRITTLHPRTYNEAVTIGEHFRSGTPVIMNLTEMADSDAKRLVDFAAGLTFGLRGRVERVTAKVFLLSPQNVTVTAQDKARIAENGFFNQS